jgi:hypothetical protein
MCAVSENILNLKEIYSNRSHYHQWVNNLGEVFLPGFGDSSVLKGTDLLPELPAMALSAVNFDSGFSETVMTIEGETGVAVHVLYDYDWIGTEAQINSNNKFLNDIIANAFGAALPALAVCLRNGIREAMHNTKDIAWNPYFTMLTGENTDPDGHEIIVFVPFTADTADSKNLFDMKANSLRIIEKYLAENAYGDAVRKYLHGLVKAIFNVPDVGKQ